MRRREFRYIGAIICIALSLSACGTPTEKTAPCKRPADLTSYADDRRGQCGPMWAVNPDTKSTLAAIDNLAGQTE